jgi:hypothetical protein
LDCDVALSQNILFDSKKRITEINTPIGVISMSWVGSEYFGACILLKDGKPFITGLYMPGNDRVIEKQLLETYLDSWMGIKPIQELDQKEVGGFSDVFNIDARPLACLMNWTTLDKGLYDEISMYEIFIAANFFDQVSQNHRK